VPRSSRPYRDERAGYAGCPIFALRRSGFLRLRWNISLIYKICHPERPKTACHPERVRRGGRVEGPAVAFRKGTCGCFSSRPKGTDW
jgi:hypothetical protein